MLPPQQPAWEWALARRSAGPRRTQVAARAHPLQARPRRGQARAMRHPSQIRCRRQRYIAAPTRGQAQLPCVLGWSEQQNSPAMRVVRTAAQQGYAVSKSAKAAAHLRHPALVVVTAPAEAGQLPYDDVRILQQYGRWTGVSFLAAKAGSGTSTGWTLHRDGVAWAGKNGRSRANPVCIQAMRTETGRPRSSGGRVVIARRKPP